MIEYIGMGALGEPLFNHGPHAGYVGELRPLLPYHVAFPQNAAVVWQIAPDHEYMLFFACEPGGVGQIQPVEQSDKLPLAEQQLP